MLKKSASAEKVEVKAEAKAEMKKVRSSLNLDLDLSLVHSLRTNVVLACLHCFSADASHLVTVRISKPGLIFYLTRAVGNPSGPPRLARLARPACLARLAYRALCHFAS
jgi:hypothetical protein